MTDSTTPTPNAASIPLARLTLDDGIQITARGLDQSVVAGYVEAYANGAQFPPIITFDDGVTCWLADGFHRVAASRFLGLVDILTDVRTGTRDDAMVYAATANVTNGRPMSRAEKQEAGERLIAMTGLSDSEIGRRLAVDQSTVTRWRATVSNANAYDSPRTVTRNGTTYEMDTAQIGRREPQLWTPERQQQRTERHIERIATFSEPPPVSNAQRRYNVILADPPWRYDFAMDSGDKIENHYPTMDIAEICALPVADTAAPDCVLFLWATNPKLLEAIEVIRAWGFNYRTNGVWIKNYIGPGYYFRQRHEMLLLAVKGSPPTPLPENRPDSVQEHPRTRHSEKPAAYYDMIEAMYPNARRVELFARQTRDGWDAWGNEVGLVTNGA